MSDGWEQIWQTSTIHWPGQESRNIILSPSWHLSLYLTVKSKQCDNKHAGWTITIFRIKNHYPILYIRFKNVSVSSVCVVLFALLCVSLCVCFAVCVTLCLLCCVCHFVFALLCVSLCVCFVVCVTLCLPFLSQTNVQTISVPALRAYKGIQGIRGQYEFACLRVCFFSFSNKLSDKSSNLQCFWHLDWITSVTIYMHATKILN